MSAKINQISLQIQSLEVDLKLNRGFLFFAPWVLMGFQPALPHLSAIGDEEAGRLEGGDLLLALDALEPPQVPGDHGDPRLDPPAIGHCWK